MTQGDERGELVKRLDAAISMCGPNWQFLQECRDSIERLEAENLRLAGEVASRNKRALEGDQSKAAFDKLYDEHEALRRECDGLRKDAERYNTIWDHCKIIYWPSPLGSYPIEHAPLARKDQRREIETAIDAALAAGGKT